MENGPSPLPHSKYHYQALSLLLKLQKLNLEDELNYDQLFESYNVHKYSLTDLCLKIEEGSRQGCNLIWFIAVAALAGYPKHLTHFWKKFGHELASQELRVLGVNGISVLWILTRIAFLDSKQNIFQELLATRSDIFTSTDLEVTPENYPKLKELFEAIVEQTNPLLTARTSFRKLLGKAQGETENGFLQKLYQLELKATRAMKAGYFSAFYELGTVALHYQLPQEALSFLKKVPQQSHDYSEARHKIGTIYYSQSLEQNTLEDRNYYLRKACKSALLSPVEGRRQLLRLIGLSFINGKDHSLELNISDPIPDAWLDAMHETTPIEWAWGRFIELKDKHEMLQKIQQLEKENKLLRELLKKKNDSEQKIEEVTKLLDNLCLGSLSPEQDIKSPLIFQFQVKRAPFTTPSSTLKTVNIAHINLRHSIG